MTTTEKTGVEPDAGDVEQVEDAHPELSCRTCAAEMLLISVADVPSSNTCLGPTRNPAACNTHGLRHQAGLAAS